MRYRVHCTFLVEADSPKQVEQFLSKDADFVEKHVMVDEVTPSIIFSEEDEEVYADIRERR